eukprot:Protomagalhaensia_sp_Gyna_25__3414@NODE_3083_length_741_cov_8_505698_g2578_i0_p1_GENE_NODE_3083_length_741_cov_8_505698_g2578_i0NODE_3083_length_741_cov_8_505698_g2578_i0_p1_ORF_typecomplete_len203_score21_57_NODE_3083_length_741_cov_8_505698_g2578_i03611
MFRNHLKPTFQEDKQTFLVLKLVLVLVLPNLLQAALVQAQAQLAQVPLVVLDVGEPPPHYKEQCLRGELGAGAPPVGDVSPVASPIPATPVPNAGGATSGQNRSGEGRAVLTGPAGDAAHALGGNTAAGNVAPIAALNPPANVGGGEVTPDMPPPLDSTKGSGESRTATAGVGTAQGHARDEKTVTETQGGISALKEKFNRP